MSIKLTPMYGYGRARTIPSRKDFNHDLFAAASAEEAAEIYRRRANACKAFVDGSRLSPELSFEEMSFGSSLGGDDFDQRIDANGQGFRPGYRG